MAKTSGGLRTQVTKYFFKKEREYLDRTYRDASTRYSVMSRYKTLAKKEEEINKNIEALLRKMSRKKSPKENREIINKLSREYRKKTVIAAMRYQNPYRD